MGTIISKKVVKSTTIHNILKMEWVRYGSVTIFVVSENIVMFEFEDEEDQKHIFDLSPWFVQGHGLSIQRWMPSCSITQVAFKWVQFWVKVHDLGLEKFSAENEKLIGDQIGVFIETEAEV